MMQDRTGFRRMPDKTSKGRNAPPQKLPRSAFGLGLSSHRWVSEAFFPSGAIPLPCMPGSCYQVIVLHEITQALEAMHEAEAGAADRLLTLVYDELRRVAAAKMAMERPGCTLQARRWCTKRGCVWEGMISPSGRTARIFSGRPPRQCGVS
jgi:hypothetical protein